MSAVKSWKSRYCLALLSAGFLALAGCGHAQAHETPQADEADAGDNDPIEPVNRGIYQFNHALDIVVLKPVTSAYRWVTPEQGREMVSHFVLNLYSPAVFVNSVLQGDPQNSFATLWRFILNSTFGVGGLFDFAGSQAGLKARYADMGETFAMYGVPPGPYVMIPIIGPSNARDAVGHLGDSFLNPAEYAANAWGIGMSSLTAVDARSNNGKVIDQVYESSLDPYATFRSGYTQKRMSDIRRAIASRDKALEKQGGK